MYLLCKVWFVNYLLLVSILLVSCSQDLQTTAEQEALEQAFAESMRDVVLEGNFTVQRAGDESAEEGESPKLQTDRYHISEIVHRAGDLWTFHTRIQFGNRDFTFPVPVNLLWAGDTPVVSVTDLGLPGMGTYTARVVFYKDSYAGTWWADEAGGNMFGRITRPD